MWHLSKMLLMLSHASAFMPGPCSGLDVRCRSTFYNAVAASCGNKQGVSKVSEGGLHRGICGRPKRLAGGSPFITRAAFGESKTPEWDVSSVWEATIGSGDVVVAKLGRVLRGGFEPVTSLCM